MADDIDDEAELALPPGPLCAKCFHQPCPCCPLPCCDLLQPGCCEDRCAVALEDFDTWKSECARVAASVDADEVWLVMSLGPWLPVSVRVTRGIR